MLSPETTKQFEDFFGDVFKKYSLKRRDEDRQAIISSTNPITLDYREHRYLYLFSPVGLTITIQDYGSLVLPAATWVPLPFPEQTRLFASGQGPDQLVFLRATDDVIPTQYNVAGAGVASAVNVAQFAGIPTQMASSDGASSNVPLFEMGVFDNNLTVFRVASALGSGDAQGGRAVSVGPFLFNGTNWDRQRTPVVFKTITATATGNTTVWTPAAGKKFRLMRFMVQVTANAAAAAAGVLEITFNDSGTNLNLGSSVFIPNAAGTTFSQDFVSGWIDLGNGALSAVANNLLQVNLSFALTAGEVRIQTAGTEE